jgi:hypothetical protein
MRDGWPFSKLRLEGFQITSDGYMATMDMLLAVAAAPSYIGQKLRGGALATAMVTIGVALATLCGEPMPEGNVVEYSGTTMQLEAKTGFIRDADITG